MKLLFLGDIVGKSGCAHVQKHLSRLKQAQQIDVCIANGENSAEGNGMTAESVGALFSGGVDVITSGNHVFRRAEIFPVLEEKNGVIRPGNLHPSAPGTGVFLLDKLRYQLCVINIQGQVCMDPCTNPFEYMDVLLQKLQKEGIEKNIIVDFHAEATSEKKAMGYYLDGRVSAVLGTHTHVQTADERILPQGTGYLTDAGMCGGKNSVLGVKKELAIEKLISHLPLRFETDPRDCVMDGVVLEIDQATGKTIHIARVSV